MQSLSVTKQSLATPNILEARNENISINYETLMEKKLR